MQGDFEAFYLRHFKAIYRVCYAFMRNAADAEDCTEDTFVKAMSCDISFENERHERSWLTTTAMNICKDKLRFYLFWKSPFWCVTGIFRLNGIFPFRWLQLSGLLQNGIFDAVHAILTDAGQPLGGVVQSSGSDSIKDSSPFPFSESDLSRRW